MVPLVEADAGSAPERQVHPHREGHVGRHQAVEMLVHLLDPDTVLFEEEVKCMCVYDELEKSNKITRAEII